MNFFFRGLLTLVVGVTVTVIWTRRGVGIGIAGVGIGFGVRYRGRRVRWWFLRWLWRRRHDGEDGEELLKMKSKVVEDYKDNLVEL